MLYTKLWCPNMPGTGLKVCVRCGGCGGWGGGWLKPIIVLSLAQAEQNQTVSTPNFKSKTYFFVFFPKYEVPKYSGKNLILYKKTLFVYMITVPFVIMEIDKKIEKQENGRIFLNKPKIKILKILSQSILF